MATPELDRETWACAVEAGDIAAVIDERNDSEDIPVRTRELSTADSPLSRVVKTDPTEEIRLPGDAGGSAGRGDRLVQGHAWSFMENRAATMKTSPVAAERTVPMSCGRLTDASTSQTTPIRW